MRAPIQVCRGPACSAWTLMRAHRDHADAVVLEGSGHEHAGHQASPGSKPRVAYGHGQRLARKPHQFAPDLLLCVDPFVIELTMEVCKIGRLDLEARAL